VIAPPLNVGEDRPPSWLFPGSARNPEHRRYSCAPEGTAQGSSLSPLLGNVYLHHVLDQWFERDVLPRMQGKAHLVRYADDFVIGFEREDDAKRVMSVLGQRFERYGLHLHPDKTRLLPFGRPTQDDRKGTATFRPARFHAVLASNPSGPLDAGP